jgi:hypothetical protein
MCGLDFADLPRGVLLAQAKNRPVLIAEAASATHAH